MFIGHFAVAFAARKAAPAISLGTMFLAVQLADLVWPVLVLAGVETFEIHPGITAFSPFDFTSYPYSHSLLALVVWAPRSGAPTWRRAGGVRAALLLAALVVSHWLLDFASHRADMPLAPGIGPKVGLGLWNSVAGTVAVEGALFAACVWTYARATKARDRIGTWAFRGLVAFLALVYVASFTGPPPPSVAAVAWSANAIWLLVAWAYWIDRHRTMAA